MSSSFPLFSRFPAEIRDMIWAAAISPRIVNVRERKVTSRHAGQLSGIESRDQDPNYLFSTSPIPPLLQTSRESRAAMQSHGYELVFSTTRFARVWFNFQQDILYIREYQSRRGGRLMYPPEFLKSSAGKALYRVERIAIDWEAQWIGPGPPPRIFAPYNPIEMWYFDSLQEVLLVQGHNGNPPYVWQNNQSYRDLWGYIECDVSEVLQHCHPQVGEQFNGTLFRQIRAQNLASHSWGKDSLRALARSFETSLEMPDNPRVRTVTVVENNIVTVIRGCRVNDGTPVDPVPVLQQRPKVKIVSLTTMGTAKCQLEAREKFWGSVQEIEDREAAVGPCPLSPFSEKWGDAVTLSNEFHWNDEFLLSSD